MKKFYEKCVEQSIKEQDEKMIDNAFDKYFRRNKKELNEAVESNV